MKRKSFGRLSVGLTLVLAALSQTSCVDSSFLDETQTTDLTGDAIFADSAYTAGFLNNIYSSVMFDVNPNRFGQGGLQTACDEAEYKVSSSISTDVMFATGTVNAVTVATDAWSTCYNKIRAVNVFLQNVDKCSMAENRKTLYKAEAHFLRAWYYFILLRHYGGVPLLGDEVYTNDNYEDIDMVRNTFAECVDYIASECNLAAADLPARRTANDVGRASAGCCWGLLSRLYLYAASPLFNGTTLTTDERLRPLVGYPEADQNRWKTAIDAAKRVIQAGQWQLYDRHMDDSGNEERGWGFYAQFLASDFNTQKTYNDKTYTSGAYCGDIFSYKRGLGQEREGWFYPASCGGNGNGGYPTNEVVESFPMKDGAAPGEGKYTYDRMNPAENRDPRFANSIVWNGASCMSAGDSSHKVYTYQGVGSTTDAIYQSTRTGFFYRKMCHRALAPNWFVGGPQFYCLIRYSEILFNYAEAVNEFYGPDYTEEIGGQIVGPYTALTMIREMAGIEPGDDGMYGLKTGMSQEEMRQAIRNERRIDLLLEGHRFFDVRRWMIADETENATVHGLEISHKLDGSETSNVVAVRQHVFRKAMYLWPIPYVEVNRSTDLLQNPYYE